MTAEPRWADQDSQSTAFEPVMEGPGTQAGTYQSSPFRHRILPNHG